MGTQGSYLATFLLESCFDGLQKSKQTGKRCQRTDREDGEEAGNSGERDMGRGRVRRHAAPAPEASSMHGKARSAKHSGARGQSQGPVTWSQPSRKFQMVSQPGLGSGAGPSAWTHRWPCWVRAIGQWHVPSDFGATLPSKASAVRGSTQGVTRARVYRKALLSVLTLALTFQPLPAQLRRDSQSFPAAVSGQESQPHVACLT